MDDRAGLILELTRLLNSQRLAVLSTHGAGQPYASFVSFVTTPLFLEGPTKSHHVDVSDMQP